MVAGAVDGELTAELGRRRGFGLHCAQAGTSALGASGTTGPGPGVGAGAIALGCVLAFLSGRCGLMTRQAGFAAGIASGSGAGSGGASIAGIGGFHSG